MGKQYNFSISIFGRIKTMILKERRGNEYIQKVFLGGNDKGPVHPEHSFHNITSGKSKEHIFGLYS